jgi:hypothetical protein
MVSLTRSVAVDAAHAFTSSKTGHSTFSGPKLSSMILEIGNYIRGERWTLHGLTNVPLHLMCSRAASLPFFKLERVCRIPVARFAGTGSFGSIDGMQLGSGKIVL